MKYLDYQRGGLRFSGTDKPDDESSGGTCNGNAKVEQGVFEKIVLQGHPPSPDILRWFTDGKVNEDQYTDEHERIGHHHVAKWEKIEWGMATHEGNPGLVWAGKIAYCDADA